MIKRTSLSAALFCSVTLAFPMLGCRDDSAPQPVADTADAAAGLTAAPPAARRPVAPLARLDPHVMKAYRVDVCYFGTMTIAHAAQAYLASLGGAEPSAAKLPDFGNPEPPEPRKAPDAKAGELDPKAEQRRRAMEARRGAVQQIPHERNARSCTVAAGLAEPAAGEVDAVLKEFAPFSVELAKDLTTAATYYQKETYTQDEFKEGKALHQKLTEKFKKFDELHARLGTAVAAWRAESPPPEDPKQATAGDKPADDPEKDEAALKMELEARKLGQAAFKEARGVMIAALEGTPDVAKVNEGLASVQTATQALKDFGEKNPTDTWSKMMVPALESFTADFGAAAEQAPLEPRDLKLITAATRLVEAHQRAITRSIVSKGRGIGPNRMRPSMPMRPRINDAPELAPKEGAAPAPAPETAPAQ